MLLEAFMKVGQSICVQGNTKKGVELLQSMDEIYLKHIFMHLNGMKLTFLTCAKNKTAEYGTNSIRSVSTGPHKII